MNLTRLEILKISQLLMFFVETAPINFYATLVRGNNKKSLNHKFFLEAKISKFGFYSCFQPEKSYVKKGQCQISWNQSCEWGLRSISLWRKSRHMGTNHVIHYDATVVNCDWCPWIAPMCVWGKSDLTYNIEPQCDALSCTICYLITTAH